MSIRRQTSSERLVRRVVLALVCTIIAGIDASVLAQAPPGRVAPGRRAEPLPVPSLLPDPEQLQSVAVDPVLQRLTDMLTDDTYERREMALRELETGAFDVDQLCAVLEQPQLNAEQRYRLLNVLRDSLVGRPRGALGISMIWRQTEVGKPGMVEISALIPGLPAEKVLKHGDKIVRIDGRELYDSNDLIVLVQTKQPGDSVRLDLLRPRRAANGDLVEADGRIPDDPVVVNLELGSAEKLRNVNPGGRLRIGVVGDERIKEATRAAHRYTPKPREVYVASGRDADLLATTPTPTADQAAVENHPLVQEAILERQLSDRGDLPSDLDRSRRWKLRLSSLRERARDPRAAPEEAALLNRVADRVDQVLRQR